MSDPNTVNVTVTATTGPLQQGMSKAPEVVEQASNRIRTVFDRLRGVTATQMGQTADATQAGSSRIAAALSGLFGNQARVGEASAAMAEKSKAAFSTVGTAAGALQAAAIQGGGAWRGLADVVDTHGGRIGGSVATVSRGLLALGGILSSGLFARMVLGAADAAGKMHDVSQQTGMSVEALSGLVSIGKTSETTLEAIAGASNKLSQNMAKVDEEGAGAAAAVRALGLDFDAFQKMSPDQRMVAVAQAMSQFGDGTGKTAAAMALFGRQGADLLPFMADLAEAGELQAKLTTEQAAAADQFGDNLVKLKGQGEGWKRVLSGAMIPALADASQAVLDVFKKTGGLQDQIKALAADGSIDRWTRSAVVGLSYLVDMVTVVKRAFGSIGDTIGAALAQGSAMLSGLASAYDRVRAGDFSGAVDSLRGAYGQMTAIGKEWLRDQEATWTAGTLGQKMRDAFEAAGKAPRTGGPVRQQLSFSNAAVGVKKATDEESSPSRVGEWDAALSEQKLAITERARAEGTFRQMSLEAELAYWQQILERTDLNEKERVALRRKAAELGLKIDQDAFGERLAGLNAEQDALQQDYQGRIRLAEQAASLTAGKYGAESKEARQAFAAVAAERRKLVEQEIQIAGIRSATQRDVLLGAIEQERLAAQDRLALGQITEQQLFAMERDFAERRRAAELADLQAKKANIDPTRDPVGFAQVLAQIEAMEQQHQQRMSQIRSQEVREAARPALAMAEGLRSGVESVLAGVGTRIRTMQSLLSAVGQMLVQTFVQAGAKMAADWIMRNLIMKAVSKVTALGQVAEQSAKAGAGGVASMAAAPFPLNLTAPAFGASMAAAAMAFAPLASAANGYDIPAGVNPMTQLHEREMVLPAKHADVIRDLADNGGAGQGRGDMNVTVRGASAGDFFMLHKTELVKALKSARRDLNF